jgi:hypothetical protein
MLVKGGLVIDTCCIFHSLDSVGALAGIWWRKVAIQRMFLLVTCIAGQVYTRSFNTILSCFASLLSMLARDSECRDNAG